MSPLVRRLLINHLLEKRAYRLEKQAERSWGETIGDPLSLAGGVATGIGGTNIYRNFKLPDGGIFGGAEIRDVFNPKNKFTLNTDSVGTWDKWKAVMQDQALHNYQADEIYKDMKGGNKLTAEDAAEINKIRKENLRALRQKAVENLKNAFKGVPKAHYATLLGGLGTMGLGSVMSGMGRAARERHDLEQAFLAGQASVPRRRGLFS